MEETRIKEEAIAIPLPDVREEFFLETEQNISIQNETLRDLRNIIGASFQFRVGKYSEEEEYGYRYVFETLDKSKFLPHYNQWLGELKKHVRPSYWPFYFASVEFHGFVHYNIYQHGPRKQLMFDCIETARSELHIRGMLRGAFWIHEPKILELSAYHVPSHLLT